MKCPECEFENRDGVKFCEECGTRMELECPDCGAKLPLGRKFCGECGRKFEERIEAKKPAPPAEGERKRVTVVFSDLSGYTALSEKLDPEELKEIMARIFGEISQVVASYEGFIEKFVGDAVMAIFGVPEAHEDDPIRAIRAAREIHVLVEAMSLEVAQTTGTPLSMHTGINTGLVVTGEIDLERGIHGVSGETVNIASRLSGLAQAGQIVVGPDTHRQAEGHFTFESLDLVELKGKIKPVQIYRLLSPRKKPSKIRRLRGLRADLIGRKVEMAKLAEAVERLRGGRGTVISICGDAGTGKSRLVEEFRSTLDPQEIQWRQAHAYAYSQNIPYFPLIDLLNRTWHIEEGDAPEQVRKKLESGIENLMENNEDVVPYVGRLYSLSYAKIERMSPEFWKSRLQESIQAILTALTRVRTVICLEDIHWADTSSLDLFRHLMSEFRHPALFLCVYRPPFSLFTSHELGGMGRIYQEIRLQDLSPSEAEDMMESLLETRTIPAELRRFIQEKVEGNPFHLEEVINALIESRMLVRNDGAWGLTGAIGESDIPSTIQGVISARLDRLERATKRILQEASVIGRAFLYEILKRITELQDQVDRSLGALERLDLIRTRSLQPDLEYAFKHALTQEVVYNGLLKKERQEVHERIGLVMEQLFQDRLPEFSETLAFHFAQGQSVHKAVDYLMRSGEKGLGRYALEEAHQYYKEAFNILTGETDKSEENEGLLIELLIQWAYVFYYRGDFKGLVDLLSAHEALAESLHDKGRLGMFYGWLGMALWPRERFRDSYRYLCRALEVGEETGDQRVIGYACTWLTWTCADLGLLEEALRFGERAQEIYRLLESDDYLYLKSLGGIGYVYWFRGERRKTHEAGKALVEFGERFSNTRSMVMGHYIIGTSHFMNGDFPSAIESSIRAIQASSEPYYTQIPRTLLGMSYLQNGQYPEAEEVLQEVASFSEEFGAEAIGTPARMGLAVLSIAKGRMSQGLGVLEDIKGAYWEDQSRFRYALSEYFLGKVYFEITRGAGPDRLFSVAKNLGFLLREAPFASKKAETHFNRLVEVSKEVGDRGLLGEAYLNLGLLYKEKKKTVEARECLSEAVRIFEECEIEVFLREAKEALGQQGLATK